MIWFAFFFALIGLSIACTIWLVPATYRYHYAQYPEDRWAAGLFNAIWMVALMQGLITASVPQPLVMRMAGAGMMIAGFALVIWARRVNPFFVPAAVVPDCVVTAGPYRFIDHPGYLGLGLVACGAFVLLGQSWAFFPAFAYLCLLIRRINVEERLLSLNFKR